MSDRKKVIHNLAALCLCAFLSACSKSFVVTGEIPTPAIEKLPLSVNLVLSEDFRNFKYLEATKDRALEQVEFGEAQSMMFQTVIGTLFTLSEEGEADLNIEPQVLEFQYAVPSETKLKLYEVYIKYRVKVTVPDGKEIADWVVKGYGKTPSATMTSHLASFNRASNVALRDIGAQLALGFLEQSSVQEYLKEELGERRFEEIVDRSSDRRDQGKEVEVIQSEGSADE